MIDEKYLKDYSWFMRDHSMDHEVSLLANLPRGALCCLLGGAVVRARPNIVIGEPWNGDCCVRTITQWRARWCAARPAAAADARQTAGVSRCA